ncbi:hypothetical protein G3A_08720 [Bacillus sp. 17376]|nr:hypothetical protein G3A_08720 [Bacillus sp. 17376]
MGEPAYSRWTQTWNYRVYAGKLILKHPVGQKTGCFFFLQKRWGDQR